MNGDALELLGEQLDELHAATGTPVTARRAWLRCWLLAHPDWSLLAVTVQRDGRLDAAAVLARRRGLLFDEIRPAGAGASDEVRLPSRDAQAAHDLAAGIVETLQGLRRAWRLVLRDLPPGDPVALRLAELLPHSAMAPGDVSPRLTLGAARDLRAYVSRNHYQQGRRLRNRLARDGHLLELSQLNDPTQIAAVLSEVVEVCRARDHELRRFSSLDEPSGLGFFRDLMTAHAALGEVELTTLRLGGDLAAYVICFRDGAAWRMWNCRFAPEWARYGPGRLSHEASLSAALEQGCTLYDWMRGDEAYKDGLSDHVYRVEDLFAASNLALWAAFDGTRRTRNALRDAKNSHPQIKRTWEKLRPVLHAVRHPRGAAPTTLRQAS